MQCHSVTFDFESARMFYAVIFETYFFYHKNMWIAATDYYFVFLLQ